MEEIIKLFKQIQKTSSLNDKKAIISENRNNELFRGCLRFLLDKNFITGISTKKIKKNIAPKPELVPHQLSRFSDFMDVINYLKKNNTGKDDDIYEMQAFWQIMKKKENFMNK